MSLNLMFPSSWMFNDILMVIHTVVIIDRSVVNWLNMCVSGTRPYLGLGPDLKYFIVKIEKIY